MLDFDLVGADAVADFIRHSKMQYFYIHRYPSQPGTIPVYESMANVNAGQAANDFLQWASIANRKNQNVIPYVITIANSRTDDDTSEDIKRAKRNKVRASFIFNAPKEGISEVINENPVQFINPANGYSREDIERMIKDATEKATLKAENERLQRELDEALEELDELDENDNAVNQNVNKLLGMAMAENSKKKEPASIAGTPNEKIIRLNKAVKTLMKHDAELDVHLAKLAEMAENQNSKFQMLLGMLDGF
jgi:hypothetical protein